MITMFGKVFNAGLNAITNMRSNNDSLSPSHEDQRKQIQELQGDTNHSGRGIHQVEETDNTRVSKDAKTLSSRDRTDLNLHKNPVEGCQEPTSKPERPKHGICTNAPYQSCSLANENATLKMQLEAKERDLTRQSEELQKRIRELQSEKEGLLAKMAKMKVERNDLFQGKTEAERQSRQLQEKNKKLEEELKMQQGTLRGVQEKNLHTTKLLEERTADLKGAQTFLTTSDSYAGAEIMKMVEALNAEIFQGAALISELLEDEIATLKEDEQRNDDTKDPKDYLTPYIGLELARHLSVKSKQVQVDPLPLQLAVQALLTSWCVLMVNSFCGGPACNDLREIYRRIWESEPQAVAGRWRAMTMSQAKHVDSTTNKNIVINLLSALLCLCGSPMANSKSQKTSLCFDQVVSTILDMWMHLRTAIHEGITTSEMQVFGANPSDIYQNAAMNDIYGDTKDVQQPDLRKKAGRILCAVGMGLQRSVIRRNKDGTTFIQRDITLKTKVVFPFVLFDSA